MECDYKKKNTSSTCTSARHPHEMFQINVQEFTELERESNSWSDLVMQHLMSMGGTRTHAPMREAGEAGEVGDVGEAGEVDEAGEVGEVVEVGEAGEAGAAGVCGESGKSVVEGGRSDELTCRLISLKNTVIDEGQLRLLHGCVCGHTLEELEEYVRLWRHVVEEREDYVRKYPTIPTIPDDGADVETLMFDSVLRNGRGLWGQMAY